jgi:hypothetical protein
LSDVTKVYVQVCKIAAPPNPQILEEEVRRHEDTLLLTLGKSH